MLNNDKSFYSAAYFIKLCLIGKVPRYLSDNLFQLDDVQQRETCLSGHVACSFCKNFFIL